MFLIDSICNYRSTEPIWFRFFRGFFAIILSFVLISYLINQNQLVIRDLIRSQNLDKIHLNISMCTGISNVMKTEVKHVIVNKVDTEFDVYQNNTIISLTPYCQNVHLHFTHNSSRYIDTYWLIINTTATTSTNIIDDTQQYMNISEYFQYPYTSLSIPNNLLFLSLNSLQLFIGEDEVLGPFDRNATNLLNTLNPVYFSLYLGRASLISFNPTIFNNGLFNKLELNPELQQLPINLESNEIQLGINFHSGTVKFEENKIYLYKDLISDLGGFYSGIVGIYILFFGMQKHEPWGLAQKYIFSCIPCRKSFMGNFARKYVSSAGIPLVEKVNKRPEESSLEERVQILETLLRDYYLDDYCLRKVKNIKIQHKRLLKKYNKMDKQNNESKELAISSENNNSSVSLTPSSN